LEVWNEATIPEWASGPIALDPEGRFRVNVLVAPNESTNEFRIALRDASKNNLSVNPGYFVLRVADFSPKPVRNS